MTTSHDLNEYAYFSQEHNYLDLIVTRDVKLNVEIRTNNTILNEAQITRIHNNL